MKLQNLGWKLRRWSQRVRASSLIRELGELHPVRWYRSSLAMKLTSLIIAVLAAAMTLLGVFVTTHVRDGIFEEQLDKILADSSLRIQNVQTSFDQALVDSTQSLQDLAYTLMSEQREAITGSGGAGVMLIRAQHSQSVDSINSIIDPQIRGTLTPELRAAVENKHSFQWQSVAIPGRDGQVVPGVLVGSYITLPLAGGYEFYLLYSLATEQESLTIINQVLLLGTILLSLLLAIALVGIIYGLLSPVRRTARAVAEFSQGKLDTRVPVSGIDEMSTLSRSFNAMAESLERQIKDYQQLAKLQQCFVSDVSHELRTPLSSIRIASDLLFDEEDELPEHLVRPVTILHTQVDRFDRMLAELIEISRIDAHTAQLQTKPTDLVALSREVIEDQGPLAEKLGVAVSLVGVEEGEVRADVDPVRIARIVQNLLVNALEYAEGGPVQVTVAGSEGCVGVQVRDWGTGMDDATAERVFDRFFRADPARKRTTGGTGLGLAISAEDAALHGGVLSVLSSPGAGSAFRLLLPKQPGAEIFDVPSAFEVPDLLAARAEYLAAQQEAARKAEEQAYDLIERLSAEQELEQEARARAGEERRASSPEIGDGA